MENNGRAELSTSAPAQPMLRQHCFVEQTPEAVIHYQVMDLGRQLYVWAAAGGAKMDSLIMAIQTPVDAMPSVATLLPGASPSGSETHTLAQRLALRFKVPVVCSWNIPANSPMLQAIAERRLIRELAAFLAPQQQQEAAAGGEPAAAAAPEAAA